MSWVTAQTLKILFYYFIHRSFSWERLFGAGGMPSSHSALVSSTCVAIYKQCGADSVIFGLSVVLAGIVMYDEMSVIKKANKKDKIKNKIINKQIKKEQEKLDELDDNEHIAIKTLKEFLGLTPLEVFCGALLGLVIGVLM